MIEVASVVARVRPEASHHATGWMGAMTFHVGRSTGAFGQIKRSAAPGATRFGNQWTRVLRPYAARRQRN